MKSKEIKFSKEYCFTIICEDAGGCFNEGHVDYQLLQADLFIMDINHEFKRVAVAYEEQNVLEELKATYDRSLLRIDRIKEEYIYCTLLEFSGKVLYDKENPMRIVLDAAASADIRKNYINQDTAVQELRKQLFVDEDVRCAFVYSTGGSDNSLEFIGNKYTISVTETPQHYLHITQIRKRQNRDRIDFPVTLICGDIEIEDELNDKARLTARANEQYSKLVKTDTEFIELWNVYNELELESIKQQAEEIGYLKYNGFRYSKGTIVFDIEGGYTRREFCVDNMYYVAIERINIADPMDYNFRSAIVIGTEIDYSCVNTREFRIKEDMDTTRSIPRKGYLLPSISGSEVQKKRRQTAQRNILSNRCQLPGLKNIIQAGEQVGVMGKKELPISGKLEREVFESKEIHFTEKQKAAIDVAINTPDIAVIQGPPGTGKTTVIRAIVKRIDELWKSRAKILITSTQHDAVDNAIEKIDYGGVPVNRVSVRRGREEDNIVIYDWIDRMIDSCESWLESNDGSQRSKVRELFEKLVLVETTDDLSQKYEMLNLCYKQLQRMGISADLMKLYTTVLSELFAKLNISDEKRNENQLRKLVSEQRLNKESYLDDGIIQLKLLEQYLKFESDINYEIPSYWKKLRRITEDTSELQGYLEQLKSDCEYLESLCPSVTTTNEELINSDITKLIKATRLELVSLGDREEDNLNSVLWEFKQELTNSNNVERLIKAYSKINAATCQQSANANLSESMNGFDEEYDFVIVDEAARSNPLDLLIPMSMGKKIILVGDHKQLPHMVERDVVEAVAQKTGDVKVEDVLEESLFMRLNNSISAIDRKNGITRTAMLTEQYRMHPDICNLVNVFYDGKLETLCKQEDKEHHLGLYGDRALAWIDMPLSESFPGEIKKQSVSRQCEVDRIQEELSKILARNENYKIGVITFYSAQAKLLNDMVIQNFPGELERIRVGTVDAFQGKEFDVVLLSVVRSNNETEMQKRVGFLDNENRLCVAFSRAKRLLVAVGDAKTVAFDGEKEYVKALHEMYNKCIELGA